jgi:predicted DCC family thiol-disulfide oxidoreductase YuxK
MILYENIILFDGVCNLCDGAINFIIKQDNKRLFRYASLQSDIGMEISKKYNLPLKDYKSFVYIKKGRSYLKSDAALEISKDIGFPWNGLYIMKFIIPSFIRNSIYIYISENRYSFFGKKDHCTIPSKEIKNLFIE